MKIKTSPSILAADFLHLADEIKRAENAGADMLHCDVMDGVYVPNMSFGFGIISQINKITSLPLDVHMMTSCPEKYIDVLKKSGASSITLHSEILPKEEMISTLKYIKSLGMNAAISLKPKYPAADVFDFVPYVDMILIMTVEPGFGGQKFMSDMVPKIKKIREYLDLHKPECSIQVDGGIGKDTIEECARAGADNFVVGTASFGVPDMKAAITTFVALAEKAYEEK